MLLEAVAQMYGISHHKRKRFGTCAILGTIGYLWKEESQPVESDRLTTHCSPGSWERITVAAVGFQYSSTKSYLLKAYHWTVWGLWAVGPEFYFGLLSSPGDRAPR